MQEVKPTTSATPITFRPSIAPGQTGIAHPHCNARDRGHGPVITIHGTGCWVRTGGSAATLGPSPIWASVIHGSPHLQTFTFSSMGIETADRLAIADAADAIQLPFRRQTFDPARPTLTTKVALVETDASFPLYTIRKVKRLSSLSLSSSPTAATEPAAGFMKPLHAFMNLSRQEPPTAQPMGAVHPQLSPLAAVHAPIPEAAETAVNHTSRSRKAGTPTDGRSPSPWTGCFDNQERNPLPHRHLYRELYEFTVSTDFF